MAHDFSSRKAHSVWFPKAQSVEIREEPVGTPNEFEIVVKSIVSLISPGSEMNVYRGQSATEQEVALPTRGGGYPFPIKFGYQVIGEVIEAGEKAGYKVGDTVFCQHPHQDYFKILATVPGGTPGQSGLVYPVPKDLDPFKAIFANMLSVGYNGLLDVPIRLGDVVAISGMGLVGTFAAYLARVSAGKLILVEPLEHRRKLVEWIGADAVVDPRDAVETINRLSDNRGADVYMELSGATKALQGAIDATGLEGTIVVGSYYGNRPVTLRLSPEFHLRRQRIVSSFVAILGSGLQLRWSVYRRTAEAMQRLRKVDTTRMTTHTFPFEQAAEAYEKIDKHPNETLGVLLTY